MIIGEHIKAGVLGGAGLLIHFYGLSWEAELRWEVNGQPYARTLAYGSSVEEALAELERKLTPDPAVVPETENHG